MDVYDPWASREEVQEEYGIQLTSKNKLSKYDAVILAVGHKEFSDMDLEDIKTNGLSVLYDTKAFYRKDLVHGRL